MENLEFKSEKKSGSKTFLFSKLPRFVKSPKILVYALLLVSLPTSVLLVRTVQDIRQRASELPATPPTPPPTISEKAIKLQAKNYVYSDMNYIFKAPVTYEAWIKPQIDPNNIASSVFYARNLSSRTCGATLGIHIARDPYNYPDKFKVSTAIQTATRSVLFGGNNEYPYDNWYHIGVTYDTDGTLNTFVNGKLDNSQKLDGTLCSVPMNLFIGTNSGLDNDWYFNGLIDEVRISNVIRSNTEFANTLPRLTDKNTIVHFRFEENINDSSSNGFASKLIGSATYEDSIVQPTPTPYPTCVPAEQFGCNPDANGNIVCVDPAPSTVLCPPSSSPTPTPPSYTPTPPPSSSPTPTPALLQADLTISGGIINVVPLSTVVNAPVNVYFKIVNTGYKPANAPYIYTSQADGISNIDTSKNTCTNSTILNPGSACVSSYNFTFPTTGTKYLTISLDPYSQIPESDETNNKFTAKTLITAVTPTPTFGAPSVTPTPTPAIYPTPTPAMCPAKLTSTTFSQPCRNVRTLLSREKGYRTVSYSCSDGYSGKISGQTCRLQSDLTSQAAQICVKRMSICK